MWQQQGESSFIPHTALEWSAVDGQMDTDTAGHPQANTDHRRKEKGERRKVSAAWAAPERHRAGQCHWATPDTQLGMQDLLFSPSSSLFNSLH